MGNPACRLDGRDRAKKLSDVSGAVLLSASGCDFGATLCNLVLAFHVSLPQVLSRVEVTRVA